MTGVHADPHPTPPHSSGDRTPTPWYMRYWVWLVVGALIIGGIVVGTISNPLPLPSPASTPARSSSGL